MWQREGTVEARGWELELRDVFAPAGEIRCDWATLVCWGRLTPARESQLVASFPSSVLGDSHHFGSVKSAMVGVFTPWQPANTISQGLFLLL